MLARMCAQPPTNTKPRALECAPTHLPFYPHAPRASTHPLPAGTAYSFFTSANARMAREIQKILEEAQQPVPPELRNYAMSGGGGGGGGESLCGRGGAGRRVVVCWC